jgi:hypothetical protein
MLKFRKKILFYGLLTYDAQSSCCFEHEKTYSTLTSIIGTQLLEKFFHDILEQSTGSVLWQCHAECYEWMHEGSYCAPSRHSGWCRNRLSRVAAGLAVNPYIDSPYSQQLNSSTTSCPHLRVLNSLPNWETRKDSSVRNVLSPRSNEKCIRPYMLYLFNGQICYAIGVEWILLQ